MTTSCGSIIIHNNKILICRPRWDSEFWNIPKGTMNDNETSYLITAIRETKEECNIDISLSKRIEIIGLVPYLKYKNLYLFLVEIDEMQEIKCNSFYNNNGEFIPEMVDYKWITIDEYHKYFSKNLITVFDLIKERIINFMEGINKSDKLYN